MLVAIPLFDRFTALDAIGPYEVLARLPDAEVVFCAREKRPYRTENGAPAVLAERLLSEVRNCDLLMVPGGFGTRAAVGDDELVGWIRQVHETAAWTTSVCTGALLLGAAGLLDGLEATTHWAAYDELARYGARPVARRVVEQGKIVTAAGVSAGIDMALTLAARIAGEDVARGIQLGIEYDPQPPFDAGSPAKAPPGAVDLVRRLTQQAR